MGVTRLAAKVIVLIRDADGFGPAISDALQPNPSSNLTRLGTSSIDLSLEKYGIADGRTSVDLVQFVDPSGSPQVSVLLLPNYEPPVAACAVNEVLALVSSEDFTNQPTIIIPFNVKALKNIRERPSQTVSEKEFTLYGAQIGAKTEITQAIIAGTAPPPLSLQIHCEPLACLLQIIPVLKLSAVLLIAPGGHSQYRSSINHELEAINTVGQSLADHVGLKFSEDEIRYEQTTKPSSAQEPWRALYG